MNLFFKLIYFFPPGFLFFCHASTFEVKAESSNKRLCFNSVYILLNAGFTFFKQTFQWYSK